MNTMNINTKKKGFTLVELLIVIGILAVLGTTAVVILNPAQLLAQARDSQRISDLGSISSAITLYMADFSPISLGACASGAGTVGRHHSGSTGTTTGTFTTVGATATADRSVDGTGWVDVDFTDISGGAPFSTLPIDPTNDAELVYRYACDNTNDTFELNAVMESDKFVNGGGSDVESTDGGENNDAYEVGNALDH